MLVWSWLESGLEERRVVPVMYAHYPVSDFLPDLVATLCYGMWQFPWGDAMGRSA